MTLNYPLKVQSLIVAGILKQDIVICWI